MAAKKKGKIPAGLAKYLASKKSGKTPAKIAAKKSNPFVKGKKGVNPFAKKTAKKK